MMYEALTGSAAVRRCAARDPDAQAARGPRRHSRTTPPIELPKLCMELLNRDPAKRPTAAAVVARLTAPRADRGVALPPFVGRGGELAALDAALDDVARGVPSTVFVEGESGIGKSALVRSFIERVEAQRRGALVLDGSLLRARVGAVQGARRRRRCARARARKRTAAEVDARTCRTTSRRCRACSRCCAAWPPHRAHERSASGVDPSSSARRAFRGCASCSPSLAATQLVVIAIDDLQWADSDSIALLREIVHPPNATAHPRRDHPAAAIRAAARAARRRPRDHARPALCRGGPRAGLADRAGPRRRTPTALVERHRWSPDVLHELARHPETLRARGVAVRRRAVGADHTHGSSRAPRARAHRGRRRAASAGHRRSRRSATRCRDSRKLIDALRATLARAHRRHAASDPIEPYHDRVREAVVARVPAAAHAAAITSGSPRCCSRARSR